MAYVTINWATSFIPEFLFIECGFTESEFTEEKNPLVNDGGMNEWRWWSGVGHGSTERGEVALWGRGKLRLGGEGRNTFNIKSAKGHGAGSSRHMGMNVGVVFSPVNLASAAVLFIFTLYTHAVRDVSYYLTHA